MLYRDCFLSLQKESSAKARNKATLRAAGDEYQNGDSAFLSDELPGICNEFVINYLPQFSKELWLPDLKDLTQLVECLCEWLFEQKMTTS